MSGEMYKDISILEHIVKYCNMVEHSVERFGADYNTFMNDEDYKNSVSMCILQVGELVNHLSSDFKNSHKDIPWSAIVGLRMDILKWIYLKYGIQSIMICRK